MGHAFAVSNPGPVRRTNEDSFAVEEDLLLFIVADGMGGHNAGEVASQLAVSTLVNFVRRSQDSGECSWPYGVEPTLSYNGNRLRTGVNLANRRVFRAADEHDEYTGMGTTIVCALLSGRNAIVAHVGDSRLYAWGENGLRQITKDDSWAATILAGEPGTSASDIAQHPMRHVLTNVLGSRELTTVHVVETPLAGIARLLLCTDGLHGSLTDGQIEPIMRAGGGAIDVAQALVDAALGAGTRDNVTALVVDCAE